MREGRAPIGGTMRSRIDGIWPILSILTLTACTTLPATQPLSPSARDQIASSEVVVPIRQSEIYVFVPDSQLAAAAGGGLLWALIDTGVNSVRTSKAEAAVRPLRDQVVDFDFDGMMRDDLKNALSQLSWLHLDTVKVSKNTTPQSADQELVSASDEAILVTSVDYQLSNDATMLTVSLNAALYPNSERLRALRPGKGSTPSALENALYRNNFSVQRGAPNSTDDRDLNIAQWSADHGAALRSALTSSAADLAKRLETDLDRHAGTTALK